MFVLRAQCRLSDASGEIPLRGLAGASAIQWLGGAAPAEVWGKVERAGMTVIRLPDAAGTARFLAAGGTAPALPQMSIDHWRWLEVRSGVARIEQATMEKFVPQMLNYELIGGVDFRKGCYPGQEIVARSQYRGAIKRRSLLFQTAGQAVAGTEVFHSDDPGQPAGEVANAAPQPTGMVPGTLALIEIKLTALRGGTLHVGTRDGPQLHPVALPYALPVEAVEPG